jgi:hypothetical protein
VRLLAIEGKGYTCGKDHKNLVHIFDQLLVRVSRQSIDFTAAALAPKIEGCREELDAQVVGNALKGLQI